MRKYSRVQYTLPSGDTSTPGPIEVTAENDANAQPDDDDYLANFKEDSISNDEDDIPGDHAVSSQTPLAMGTKQFKLDARQKQFFSAVEENDLEKVRGLICGELPAPDVNIINLQRRSPLIVAIRAKHLDMIMLLLQCGATVGDALLHAVETGSPVIVRLICNFLEPTKETLTTVLDGFATEDSFLPAATPLMYAAKENNENIVKILVEHGAELPTLDAVLSRTKGKSSYEQSIARLFWHQAISGEAYLLYATNDPVEAAFNAGRIIKKCKENQLPHLKAGYEQLVINLDNFITRYLELARNSGEISTLLCEEEPRAVPRKDRQSTLPQRVLDALNLNYKQVIAHQNCIHFVLDQWYHPNWQDLTMLSFILWTSLIVVLEPILCIFYIIYPFQFIMRSMKTPYVCFLMHWASRISFIFFLMFSNIATNILLEEGRKLNRCEQYMAYASQQPGFVMCLVYIWIVGISWREMKEMWVQGFKSYFKDVFNIIDCLQLTLYWASIVLKGFVYTIQTYYHIECNNRMNQPTPEDVASYVPSNDTWKSSQIVNNSSMHIVTLDVPDVYPTYSPLLLSEAAFAVATVLTFMSSLRDIAILAFVGPLRVSLGGMISDIVCFVFLFTFVWISFGIGLTHLYRTYDVLNRVTCGDQDGCEMPRFASFLGSMDTLFWSLFGPIELEELDVSPDLHLIGTVGLALYGAYMTVAAVVMLNALIAMMSNTYTKVEENSEVMWRVARTRLMAEYMTKTATLPPPFNLVPTLKVLKRLIVAPYYFIHGDARRRKQMARKAQAHSRGRRQDKYKLFMLELTERYLMSIEMEEDEDQILSIKEDINSLHEAILAVRNEMHEIRAENGQLCDHITDLCKLMQRSTSSVAVQTRHVDSEIGSLARNSKRSISSEGRKRPKGSTLGKRFSKLVTSHSTKN